MNRRIKLDENLRVLNFNFLNGSIQFDEDEYGAYAMCPGCGSGKTTLIRELIRLKWNEGVLYSAFTKDEVELMRKWIDNNLVGKSIINGRVLTKDDVVVLHSSSEDNCDWHKDPKDVMDKSIILCTHHKLMNEPIDVLLGAELIKACDYFTRKSMVLKGLAGYLPRQWVLIDEGIEVKPIIRSVDKGVITALSNMIVSRDIPDPNNEGEFITEDLEEPLIRLEKYSAFLRLIKKYKKVYPAFSQLIKDEKTKLDELRNNQVTEELYDNFLHYFDNFNQSVRIKYGFSSLSIDHIVTHVILFDGTSDLTLRNSKKFKLLTYPNKYNSKVNLTLFPFNLERKLKNDKSIVDYDRLLRDKLDKVVDDLCNVINNNSQTLIFTWMNFKVDNSEVNDDEDELSTHKIVEDVGHIVSNKNFLLTEYIKSKLMSRGYTDGKEFSIEYYGSGKDKAINDYRNYDAVVLLGKYIVPKSVVDDFRDFYESETDQIDYYTNRAVQAICRTRIRLHNKLPINVYISSDWSGNVINSIARYLNVDKINGYTTSVDTSIEGTIDTYYTQLRKIGVSPKRAENIAKISTLDGNIIKAILTKSEYSCTLRLNDVYQVLPTKRKEADSYRYILKSMSLLGVNVTIS